MSRLLSLAAFLIQWLVSEKAAKSIVPTAFWYFSIGGGICLFIYGIKQAEPIIILGQSVGLFIYARNLYFIKREKRNKKQDVVILAEANKASDVPPFPKSRHSYENSAPELMMTFGNLSVISARCSLSKNATTILKRLDMNS